MNFRCRPDARVSRIGGDHVMALTGPPRKNCATLLRKLFAPRQWLRSKLKRFSPDGQGTLLLILTTQQSAQGGDCR